MSANVWVLLAVYGKHSDEVAVTLYADKETAVAAFTKIVEDFMEPDADAELTASELAKALKTYFFTHKDGFISLDETPVIAAGVVP